jgi:hypothetical protein
VPFTDYAKSEIVPLLRLDLVEAIADTLDAHGQLTADDIRRIRAGFGASPAA